MRKIVISEYPRVLVFYLLMAVTTLFSGCDAASRLSLPDDAEIKRRVSTVLEMPTYEYMYRDIVYIADQASFLGIRHRDTQLLFAIDVRLQAGIDLKKGFSVTPSRSGAIEVRLPAPEILLVDADESSIHQYFKREYGGEINRLDYYDEIDRSKEKIRTDATSRGVLVRAEENAASLIESVAGQAGFTEVSIIFEESPSGDKEQ